MWTSHILYLYHFLTLDCSSTLKNENIGVSLHGITFQRAVGCTVQAVFLHINAS